MFIEQLKQEMARQGINARELAIRASLGRSFVYDLLSGRSANPTTNKLSAIADALGVSLPYLISGTSNDNDASSADDYLAVPLLSYATQHSEGVVNDAYRLSRKWLREVVKLNPADAKMVVINGDGMSPTINNNDIVLIDTSCVTPAKAEIFILHNRSSMIARRMEFVPGNTSRQVFISPDNTRYIPHSCDISEVKVLGRVVWLARLV